MLSRLGRKKKSLYKLLNLDPDEDDERSKYDDRAVVEAVRRNPDNAKRTHKFTAFNYKYYPLSLAVMLGCSLEAAEALYEANPQAIKHTNSGGGTVLHWACQYKVSLEVATFLVEKNPSLLEMKKKYYGYTPLHVACYNGAHLEVVEMLLERYPPALHIEDKAGRTPLMCAKDGSASPEVISFVEKAEAAAASSLSIPRSIRIHTKRLKLGRKIGQGAFGEVFEGTYSRRDGNTEPVAFKQFNIEESELSEDDNTSIERELEVLRSFQLHENVVTLLGACSDSEATDANGRRIGFGVMLELADLGSLRKYLVNSALDTVSNAALSILLDVAQGMLALHSHRPHPIIHRDLKSMNVLLFSKPSQAGIVAKISDFGLARAVTDSSAAATTKGVGTPNWMAPETYLDENCTAKSDVWSFGLVIYEVATCRIPYQGVRPNQLLRKMDKKVLPEMSHVPSSFPSSVSSLMKECCNFEPKERPRFGAIVERLSDLLGEEQATFHSVQAGSVEERLELQRKLRELKEQLDKQAAEDSVKYSEAWESLSAEGETTETLRILSKFAAPRLATPCQPEWISSIDDLVADAEACYQDMQDEMRSLVEQAGGGFLDAPLKKRDRLEHKVSKDYDGECRRVVDVVRATGLFESLSQVKAVVELLENSKSLAVIRCKDRLNHPLKSGYRDVLLNVVQRKSDGPSHVAELQLHLRSIEVLKPSSHRVYELQRLAGWVLE